MVAQKIATCCYCGTKAAFDVIEDVFDEILG